MKRAQTNKLSINTQSTPKKRRKRWLIAVLCAVVLLAIAGGVYYWWSLQQTAQDEPEQAENEGILIESPDTYRAEVDETSSIDEKIDLLQQLATSQQLEGDYEGALETAQELLTLDESASTYALLGSLYDTTGQTDKAIESYEKAVELSPETPDSNMRSDYNTYKEILAELREKG